MFHTQYITEYEMKELLAQYGGRDFALPEGSRLTPGAADLLWDWEQHRPPQASPGTKPEYMTHLRSGELVCKTHPVILFRGRLDSLESNILLLMCEVKEPWQSRLKDALLLLRQIMAADVKNVPLEPWTLNGMNAEQVHRSSHHPEEFGYKGHILPSPEDGALACRLNCLRAESRSCELSAVNAYMRPEKPVHEDILLALNRLSSYFYVLQLMAAAQERRT